MQEEHNDYFEVQRSANGVDFTTIGIVQPGQTTYVFTDKQPLTGYNYYRLKAVDIDGTFEIFKVRSAQVGGTRTVNVYPNPVRGNEIRYALNFNPSEGDRIRIINSMGKELLNTGVSNTTGTFMTGDGFVSGIYFMQYMGANHKQTVRLFSAE